MATLTRVALTALLLAGCGNVTGFGGAVPPLATIPVQTSGDFSAVALPGAANPELHIALVWGNQWLTEAFCIVPPDNQSVAAVVAAGCRDPFGFVPDRVAASVAVDPGVPATIELADLPGADVMVGDVTARVAYGSFVIYDDRDHDGTLTLSVPNRLGGRDMMGPPTMYKPSPDVVYGASFVTMTAPDTRLAYREGGFNEAAAFYPRRNCGDPPPAFSLVSAGGFSAADAIAATAAGMLPPEDPNTCHEGPTTDGVTIAFQPPSAVHEVQCVERSTDSSIRYREPPADPPDMTKRTVACAKVPDFGTGTANGAIQLVISGRSDDQCQSLTHYVLRGCRQDPSCAVPDWDITATPPSWWPCPAQAM